MIKQPPEFLQNKLKENEVSAEWLAARAKIQVSNSKNNNSFTANIRFRKDSVIWVTISPLLGIEAARVLITKDSIKVMDKINKKFLVKDYTFLQTFIPYRIDYNMLQKILLGNMIFYNADSLISDLQDDSLYVLVSDSGQIMNDIYFNKNYEIVQSFMKDKILNQQMRVQLKDYKVIDGKNFSFSRLIEIFKAEKITISMDFEKVKFNEPTDFPFTIKENYSEEH